MKKEIVFGSSAHGSLETAQIIGVGEVPKWWLFPDEEVIEMSSEESKKVKELNKERIYKWNHSKAIGGDAKDIIRLEYNLAFGDISEQIPSKKRYESILKLISKMYTSDRHGDLAVSWVNDIKRNNEDYLNELEKAIKEEQNIRIWYSSCPDEINAFYWLMSFFDSKNYYKNISAVYLPPNYWCENCYRKGISMLESEMFSDVIKLEKDILEEQIKQDAKHWQNLQKENTPMRLMVSGNLVSLPEDFLDSFIYRELNKLPETFKIANLIGNVMGEYGLMVSDFVLFERVMNFIEKVDLELIEEWNENPMNTNVKKRKK